LAERGEPREASVSERLRDVNAQYTYLFVGYADDKSGALYLNSLHGLVETMRYGHPRKVKTQVRLAANPGQLRDLLTEGADLLIYGGHGGIEDDRPYLGAAATKCSTSTRYAANMAQGSLRPESFSIAAPAARNASSRA
jgi:hypothetical protein